MRRLLAVLILLAAAAPAHDGFRPPGNAGQNVWVSRPQ